MPGLYATSVKDGSIVVVEVSPGHKFQLNAIHPHQDGMEDSSLLVGREGGDLYTLYSPYGVFSGPLVVVGPTRVWFKGRGSGFDLVGSVVVVDSFEGFVEDRGRGRMCAIWCVTKGVNEN